MRNNVLICGSFSCGKEDNTLGIFLREILGIHGMELSMFMGKYNDLFLAYAKLPTIHGSILWAENLYLGMEYKNKANIVIKGTFRFSFMKDAVFRAKSYVDKEGVQMEAFAHVESPIPIIKNFKIGDTVLVIRVGSGITFRMFVNLYIGEIKAFGALGVECKGQITNLEFISAAITDVTIPKLMKNLCGDNVDWINELDFIRISGLPLSGAEGGVIAVDHDENVKSSRVKGEIVERFNNLLHSEVFWLNAESVNVERNGSEGLILTDKSRMRHYQIDRDGRLSLQAQFYYSLKEVQLGDYQLKRGIFVCGSITLFHKVKVTALFSLSDTDGIIAYANVTPIHLGILTITSSGLAIEDNPLDHFSKDNLIWTLMDCKENPNGAVFFLRAGRNECNFYIDGRIELFQLLSLKARILYTGGYISIQTMFDLGGLIKTSIQVRANYENFSDGEFMIQLIVDCNGLEKQLKQAQASIESAIGKLRKKVNDAKASLIQAQNNVNQLHTQIDTLNCKINECRDAISHAKWYKKAFVAIAKGIEIAAYEVAKAGVYVAIGVANAALEVAKLAVDIGSIVGEGVLQAVNAAITATLNFLFVKYVRLCAKANTNAPQLEMEIEFVALGKTYTYRETLGARDLLDNPRGMLDDSITGSMSKDLENIEQGTFAKRNIRLRQGVQRSMQEHEIVLEQGMEQIEAGTALLKGIQEAYFSECGENMPEYGEFKEAYEFALGEVEAVMGIADDVVNHEQIQTVVDGLKTVAEQENRPGLASVIEEYEKAAELTLRMMEERKGIKLQKESLDMQSRRKMQQKSADSTEKLKRATISDHQLEKILNDVEKMMYTYFPPTKLRGDFINLSRESKIKESFDVIRRERRLKKSVVLKGADEQVLSEYIERL